MEEFEKSTNLLGLGDDNQSKQDKESSSNSDRSSFDIPNKIADHVVPGIISDEPLEEQLKRCKTKTSVFLILNTKLRAQQTYGIGDSRLYSNLTDASRYIQLMCAKSSERQNALRVSGVLNTLVEAFLTFFLNHLEDHNNPIIHERLIKCWSNVCTAICEAVENPINKRNQEQVLGKLIERHDLKVIQFVVTSTRSVEKQTEKYVIPIILIFKALVMDNDTVKQMMLSRRYFVPSLAEGLLFRLQLPHHDLLLWKSIDLMALLLSLILQVDNKSLDSEETENEKNLNIFCNTETTDVDRSLLSLVTPCLSFVETDRISEKTQSIGIIMLFASILGRNLDIVQRFISAGGEVILSQIFSSQPPNAIINTTKLTFQVLNIQKKRMRESGIDNSIKDGMSSVDNPNITTCTETICKPPEDIPPLKRRREDIEQPSEPIEPNSGYNDFDDDDRASMISINIPRKKMRSNRKSNGLDNNNMNAKHISSDELSKIIKDLRPCDFMETDEHIVVFCTPNKNPVKETKKVDKNRQIEMKQSTLPNPSSTVIATQNRRQTGIFERLFQWLFQ